MGSSYISSATRSSRGLAAEVRHECSCVTIDFSFFLICEVAMECIYIRYGVEQPSLREASAGMSEAP